MTGLLVWTEQTKSLVARGMIFFKVVVVMISLWMVPDATGCGVARERTSLCFRATERTT